MLDFAYRVDIGTRWQISTMGRGIRQPEELLDTRKGLELAYRARISIGRKAREPVGTKLVSPSLWGTLILGEHLHEVKPNGGHVAAPAAQQWG